MKRLGELAGIRTGYPFRTRIERVENRVAGIQRLRVQEQELLEKIKERRRIMIEGLMHEAVRRAVNL